jgi:putative lipoic acid-binding regulatory protein
MKKGVMQFPCAFPVKVMGLNTEAFSAAVVEIFRRHLPGVEISCTGRLSSGNKYLSLTVTITAESQEQLNAIYEDLNRHELVLMTL